MLEVLKVRDYINALQDAGLLVKSRGLSNLGVKYVTYNSQNVVDGTLFVCKGAHFKEKYLLDSISKGAICYVSEKTFDVLNGDCAEIIVSDIRKAMPIIANTYYGNVSQKLKMIGITGTKGKSTTTYFMRYILDDYLQSIGKNKSAICSGIDNYDGVIEEESHLTTPEIMELYEHMNNAVNSNIEYLTMEVSSQALKYNRVDGIDFEVGCFLNIGSDHISAIEHPDFDDYFESKLRIFNHCRKACINIDCDHADDVKKASNLCDTVISFSQLNDSANVYAHNIASCEGRVSMDVISRDIPGCADIQEHFVLGTFGTINVENALAAISISMLLGIPIQNIKNGLSHAVSPGRMEVFYSNDGKKIAIVDYAHNKLSYEKFFETIKGEFPDKKMIIVFGCPGGKAFARREELGTIAGKNCAYSIITEEDYGEEDVNKICNEIADFVRDAGGECEIITDRVEAIKKAITLMDEETILFLPGKGRETREKRGIEYIDTPSDADVVIQYMK